MDSLTGATLTGTSVSGTVFGNPSIVTGFHGNALTFDGVDDYVEFNISPATCLTDIRMCTEGLTISLWIFPFDTSQYSVIFTTISAGDTNYVGFHLLYTSSGLFIRYRTDSHHWQCQSNQMHAGKWSHITVVWSNNGASIIDIYHNAVVRPACTSVPHSTVNVPEGFRIGADYSGSMHLDASLDEMYLFQNVLSADQVHRLYRSGFV